MAASQKNIEIRGQHIAPVYLERKIPRLQILCGSRLKPDMAIKVLRLTDVEHEDIVRGKNVGRVRAVSGDYQSKLNPKAGKIRLLVGETLMGMSAVDITGREYIHAALPSNGPVIQVRAGTAGGNNSEYLVKPVMGLGDIVISKNNIGSAGAIEQALGYFRKVAIKSLLDCKNPFRGGKPLNATQRRELAEFVDEMKGFAAEWQKVGGTFTEDGRFLIIPNSNSVVAALEHCAGRLGYSYYAANTFSKESLYGEDAAKIMFWLREKYCVLASEMEQLMHAFIAALAKQRYGVRVLSGMIVETIGAVPGPGFPDRKDRKQMALQEKVEGDTLAIAAEALFYLSKIKPPE